MEKSQLGCSHLQVRSVTQQQKMLLSTAMSSLRGCLSSSIEQQLLLNLLPLGPLSVPCHATIAVKPARAAQMIVSLYCLVIRGTRTRIRQHGHLIPVAAHLLLCRLQQQQQYLCQYY